MQQKKAQCPVCKAVHVIHVANNKLVYTCPSCDRTVRFMAPSTIVPKRAPKVIKVSAPEEIAQKVVEEVAKVVEKKSQAPKKNSKKSKKSSKES